MNQKTNIFIILLLLSKNLYSLDFRFPIISYFISQYYKTTDNNNPYYKTTIDNNNPCDFFNNNKPDDDSVKPCIPSDDNYPLGSNQKLRKGNIDNSSK